MDEVSVNPFIPTDSEFGAASSAAAVRSNDRRVLIQVSDTHQARSASVLGACGTQQQATHTLAPNCQYRALVTPAKRGRGGWRAATGDGEEPTPVAAHALGHALRAEKREVFIDTRSIGAGQVFLEPIREALAQANVVLCLIGPDSDVAQLSEPANPVSFERRRTLS